MQSDREGLRSAENLSSDLMKEKAQLQKTMETLKENLERQVHQIKIATFYSFVYLFIFKHDNSWKNMSC